MQEYTKYSLTGHNTVKQVQLMTGACGPGVIKEILKSWNDVATLVNQEGCPNPQEQIGNKIVPKSSPPMSCTICGMTK